MKVYGKNGIGRREFLRTLSASASVATIAVPVFATQTHADSETTDEKRKARYQANSSDIKAYYRVNRYPT